MPFIKIEEKVKIGDITRSDPVSNPRLRDVIAKAKQNNMPNDTIELSIKKAAGELSGVNYESCVYLHRGQHNYQESFEPR